MIKRLITVVLFCALAAIHAAGQAQPNRFPPINLVAGDPTGTACPANSIVQSSTSGILYSCQGGAYRMPGGTSIPPTMVTWPPSCTTGTYIPATNTCVPTGTAANPGGTAGQTQINAGGGTFVGIPGSVTDATFGWKTQGGTQYVKGWQSGAGNNGIANAFASPGTGIADPSYANTETYTLSGATGLPTSHSQLFDYRQGQTINYFRNPANNLYDAKNVAVIKSFQMDTDQSPHGDSDSVLERWYAQCAQPGVSIGSSSLGGFSGWTKCKAQDMIYNSYHAGLDQPWTVSGFKSGTGDFANYIYNYNYGGTVSGSDQGNNMLAINGGEQSTTLKGTIAAGGGGTGVATIKIACTVDCTHPGQGRYLINTQTKASTGNIKTVVQPVGNTPGNVVTDQTYPTSTAWATITNNTAGSCLPADFGTPRGVNGFSTTCNVTMLSGTFNVGDHVCFSGSFWEQANITAVTGTTITLPLRYQHVAGSWIMAGPPCGTFLDLTANDVTVGTVVLRYPFPVIGSTASDTLQFAWFAYGTSFSYAINRGRFFTQAAAVTNLTNLNGVVTMSSPSGSVSPTNYAYLVDGSKTITISNAPAGPPTFNGQCTNASFVPGTSGGSVKLQCNQTSSNGAAVVPSGATISYGTSGYGNTAYDTYAGAEVEDVQDYSTNPPKICPGNVCTLTLEPNTVAWNTGDAVELPHHPALFVETIHTSDHIFNPVSNSQWSFSIGMSGDGVCCGLNGLQITNGQAVSTYAYHGGLVNPPGGIQLGGSGANTGLFNSGVDMFIAPGPPGAGAFHVGCPQTGCTDINYGYWGLSLDGTGNAHNGLFWRPAFNEMTITGNVVLATNTLGTTNFADTVFFKDMAVPALSTVTTQPRGGTLLDATNYCYKVTALGITTAQVTAPSNEVCRTTGSSGNQNANVITWTRVQGAIQYRVYGGIGPGTEALVNGINGADTVTYLDNGTWLGGTIPATNTTRGGVDGAAYLGASSPGTAFELKLQAPANMAATTTITVTKITTISITPAAVTASTCAEQTFNTYTGLATGQVVTVSPPAFLGAHVWIASTRVSAANTLAIAFCADATGGTPASGIYSAMAF